MQGAPRFGEARDISVTTTKKLAASIKNIVPAGYLMVETDDEVFAKYIAHEWGEKRLRGPFVRAGIH